MGYSFKYDIEVEVEAGKVTFLLIRNTVVLVKMHINTPIREDTEKIAKEISDIVEDKLKEMLYTIAGYAIDRRRNL